MQNYYPKMFIKSQRQIMCGSNFYGSDVRAGNKKDLKDLSLSPGKL